MSNKPFVCVRDNEFATRTHLIIEMEVGELSANRNQRVNISQFVATVGHFQYVNNITYSKNYVMYPRHKIDSFTE